MAQEIAYKSITMLKNQHNILPLAPNSAAPRTLVVAPNGTFLNTMSEKGNLATMAIPLIGNRGKNKGYLERLVAQGNKAKVIIFAIINNHQLNLLTQVMSRLPDKKFIVVNMGSPYLFSRTSKVSAYILSYSSREEAQRAAAETVLGLSKPSGKLPVSIPGHFKIGYGLTYNKEEAFAARQGK
jgi:beta-N-acetylhexosaminidase